ncbi:gb [Venturia nashicola]|uniref:Gb n=1 Tax=Venturia nashicola TaxID=86259 RepID=A0A4Z1NUR3_9PEZI|nr:gb [Venturia nashicola]TLD30139.1 gb [Venturia nashicola]
MGLIFYSVSLLTLVAGTVLYATRAYWIHHVPIPERFIHYAPLPQNFREDVEAGLHSADFDMTGNVEGDSRSGLDETAKKEILRIMKRRGVGFDEGRRIFMEQNFKKGGIGKDGLPKDPKLVTFS